MAHDQNYNEKGSIDTAYARHVTGGSSLSNVKSERSPTAVDTLCHAEERVSAMVQQLSELTDRLCGARPSDDAGGPTAVPNGLFDDMQARAQDIAVRADRGLDMINRINRALP